MKKRIRIKKLAILLMALLLLLSSSGCTLFQASYTEGPAIWKVVDSKTGNTLYLFGSIHVAEDSLYPLNDTIMEAYESCDYLAVEADLLSYQENIEQQMEISNSLIYLDGRTITDEIDESLVDEASEILESADLELGVPITMLTMFKPYMWTSLLSQVATDEAGLYSEDGVDMHFMELAREEEKQILEVESIESQMELLTGFSPEIQTYLFSSALDIDGAAESVTLLYEAWKAGDVDALLEMATAESSDEEIEEDMIEAIEEYDRLLVTERNDLMSDTAEAYLQEGQQVFYVVGAMHMVGETGIVEQLKSRGYKVTRL